MYYMLKLLNQPITLFSFYTPELMFSGRKETPAFTYVKISPTNEKNPPSKKSASTPK